MQVALIAIALFGFNLGLVEYVEIVDEVETTAYLLCVDNGAEGVCYDATGEVVSAYDCGPLGCRGF